ncbi:MAG: ATP-grasp domain-containing protein [Chthonomonas sp.]|nr:ATP-grasp domain-containing protein [Chthonomonas sp.]
MRVLIANRGEIAIRIMRTLREMGIPSVAIYSDADRDALHPKLADQAIAIGGNAPAESYLDMAKVIAAAKESGADAIHPGYGFLSERAEFADECRKAGIRFIGPSPEAMRALGGKIESKQIAVAAGVPITPGFFEPGATDTQLERAAMEIGFPVMLKASAGGGGRGMRAVHSQDGFSSALQMARDEAVNAFGDGAMMVEKLVQQPRHIEVQIIADEHGNVAPLFERECSIQRRHQKLLEECPSPLVEEHPELWDGMREAAVSLIKKANYTGAGTCEFIVDPVTREFYFLEVNARLQVEHTVTEGVTGLDLVRLQIEVANGKTLKNLIPEFLDGDRRNLRGHCLEARIVAENPAQNFLPSIGKILAWAEPRGVRVDTGFAAGSEVSSHYDSMIAKVITEAPDRAQCLERMVDALEDFHVLGVHTNIAYLLDVVQHPEFASGNLDTGFLARHFEDWSGSGEVPAVIANLMAAASLSSAGPTQCKEVSPSAWSDSSGWRNARA